MTDTDKNYVSIKTSELTGPALRYAVAVAAGHCSWEGRTPVELYKHNGEDCFPADMRYAPWKPDRDWSELGPLIERFKVCITYHVPKDRTPMATTSNRHPEFQSGETVRVAACRAIAAAHHGDYADVPRELVEGD